MRICIGGKNNIAVDVCSYICDSYPDIELSVIPTKGDDGEDGFQRSLKKYAEDNGIKIVTLKEIYEWEDLVFISTEFDRIIRPERFKTKELFNIHFSKLPQYKGCHTAAMPILNGEKTTGVTFHVMDAGIDTGDIIDQKTLFIEDNETCGSLYLKLIELGTKTVINNLKKIIQHTYVIRPQSAEFSTYYPRTELDYANAVIDYNRTAKQIDRQFRAYSFRAYQFPKYNDTPIVATKITQIKSNEKPGALISEDEDSFLVATIDYDILLLKDKLSEIINIVNDGDLEKLKSIAELELYINEHDNKHGWTLLMVAAYNNHFEVANYLISLGSDVNAKNNNGTTVIMYAKNGMLRTGDERLFKYLLSKGANPFISDNSNKNLFAYIDDDIKEKIFSMC